MGALIEWSTEATNPHAESREVCGHALHGVHGSESAATRASSAEASSDWGGSADDVGRPRVDGPGAGRLLPLDRGAGHMTVLKQGERPDSSSQRTKYHSQTARPGHAPIPANEIPFSLPLPLSPGVESGRRAVAGRRACALGPAARAQQRVIPSGAVVGVQLACHPERSEPKASVVEGSRSRRMAGGACGPPAAAGQPDCASGDNPPAPDCASDDSPNVKLCIRRQPATLFRLWLTSDAQFDACAVARCTVWEAGRARSA